jgi:hypothetical protein
MCEEIGAQFDLYLDGQMERPEAEAFKKHLAACKECAAVLANRAALRKRLRTAARDVEIPPALAERVRFSVAREAEREYRQPPYYGKTLWAIAAALVISAAGFYYWPSRAANPAPAETQAQLLARVSAQVPPIMRFGLTQHVHCGVFREYPRTAPKLIEMAMEKGASPALIDAVESHLPEACHMVMAHRCGYKGRTYTHFIARGDGGLMSLLITKREEGEAFEKDLKAVAEQLNTPIYAASSDKFAMDAFETPEYLVFLVSDFDAAVNLKSMKAMVPQLRAALL